MATQTPDQPGTRVEVQSTNTSFQLVTSNDDADECAAPGCHAPPGKTLHNLSLTLGADLDGMVADYGDVEFCSLECTRAFVDIGSLFDVEWLESSGVEVVISAGTPVIAHVHLGDLPKPIFSALGHDLETATDRVTAWLIDECETLAAVGDEDLLENYSISFETLCRGDRKPAGNGVQ